MTDIRIPEHQWREFCEDFTRQHHGWLTGVQQLETSAIEAGREPHKTVSLTTSDRPLQELRAGRTHDVAELMVTVGSGVEETSYLIEDAIALYRRMRGKTHQGVRIDSGNGTTTLVEFRVAAEPETLDGLAR